MRTAIFSDVHANLPALGAFIEATRDEVDRYLCLGDIVNYGPYNDECLERVHNLPGIQIIEGNHERLLLGTEPLEDEIPLVQAFTHSSKPSFSRVDLIRDLLQAVHLTPYTCVHTVDHARVYADTTLSFDRHTILGHTHHQFRITRGDYEVINVGSVGQNRGTIDVCSYGIYDHESQTVSLHNIPYPFDDFMTALQQRGYPQQCIDYYANKPRANP